jgi:hypothetical protein
MEARTISVTSHLLFPILPLADFSRRRIVAFDGAVMGLGRFVQKR